MTSPSESSKSAPTPAPTDEVGARPRELLKPRRDALTRLRHDLRSSVHSVIGYAELLENPTYGGLSPEQMRFLGHVRAAAAQLEELVDTCIELTSPPQRGSRPPVGTVPLSAALAHVKAGLASGPFSCSLDVAEAIAAYPCPHELPHLLRAVRSLALVVTREGERPCSLRAFASASSQPVVELGAGPQHDEITWSSVDSLEAELGNRDFVRLKLGEALLNRLGISLRVAAELDCFRLCFDSAP